MLTVAARVASRPALRVHTDPTHCRKPRLLCPRGHESHCLQCHASHALMYFSTRSKNCPNASVHSCCSLAYRLRHLFYSPPAGTRSRKTNRPYGKRLPAELEVSTQCLRSIQRQVPGVPLVPGHGAASCARCHLVFWWTEPPRMRPPVELPSVFESIATSTVLRPLPPFMPGRRAASSS